MGQICYFKDTLLLCACWLNRFSVETLSFVLSIDREEELVSLSLLPEDTGKSDVLPESLGLPLRLVGKGTKRNPEKEKNKRKLSESEQVSHRLAESLTLICSAFKHGRQISRFLAFSNVF